MSHLIKQTRAIQLVCFILSEKYSFVKVSAGRGISRGSHYFSKQGWMHRKIRVSDHRDPKPNDDVIHNVIIDYDTITSDVEYLAMNADRVFTTTNRTRKY